MSAPTLNNHPDADFCIFNPTIQDCFSENKEIKITHIANINLQLLKNMDWFFVVVVPPHGLNHSLESGTGAGLDSLPYCLCRAKITSIKSDVHEF